MRESSSAAADRAQSRGNHFASSALLGCMHSHSICGDVHDSVLGRLVYDAATHGLAFRAAFRAGRVWVQLSLDSCEDVRALIASGRRFVARLEELEHSAATAAAKRLAAFTMREFRARFELESLVVHPDGNASMIFDEGVLFDGRLVVVSLNADGLAGSVVMT